MRRVLVLLAPILLLAVLAAACDYDQTGDARERAVAQRNENFERAERLYPNPRPENFPLRDALVKFTMRQDEINHPWYVYVLGNNGNLIGYYVAQTVPINACNFLSSTEALWVDVNNDLSQVLTAPSLDGIYYGGGGAAAGCDSWFFFDSATDALIQIRGVNWYAADQPLKVAAEPITVAVPSAGR